MASQKIKPKIKPKEELGATLSAKELRDKFGWSMEFFRLAMSQGLPAIESGRHKRFDAKEVEDWLKTTGRNLDGTERTVFSQVPEICRKLGVHRRTYHEWMACEGFPGVRDYHPFVDILRWLSTNKPESVVLAKHRDRFEEFGIQPAASTSPADSTGLAGARTELTSIKAREALMNLEIKQGLLIYQDDVVRFYRRTVASTISVLNDLSSRIDSQLPDTIEMEIRDIIRRVSDKSVEDSITIIRELVDGDIDEGQIEDEDID